MTTPTETAPTIEASDSIEPPRRIRRRLLSRVSIQSKLLVMLLVTSILSAAVVGFIGYQSGRSSLRVSVFDRLTEIRQAQSRQLQTGIADLKNSLVVYSRGSTAQLALEAFTAGFDQLGPATIDPAQQQSLVDYYSKRFAKDEKAQTGQQVDVSALVPTSNAQRYLQTYYTVPFGEARTHREGDDISLITWGAMVYTAHEAAQKLEGDGVSVEILDLRTLAPWDKDAVLRSVEKTSKALVLHEDTLTGGFGAEIAATIAEEAFENLDAPVRRIAAPDTPVPFSPPLEKAFIPQVEDVVAGLKELAEY